MVRPNSSLFCCCLSLGEPALFLQPLPMTHWTQSFSHLLTQAFLGRNGTLLQLLLFFSASVALAASCLGPPDSTPPPGFPSLKDHALSPQATGAGECFLTAPTFFSLFASHFIAFASVSSLLPLLRRGSCSPLPPPLLKYPVYI